MAKCEKRQIVPPPPPVEYVLTLSAAQALALMKLLAGCCLSNATHEVWMALDRTVER